MSLTNSTGMPSAVAFATGPTVSPKPCVNVSVSLIQFRFGRPSVDISRGDSITCVDSPLILYRSLSTDWNS